MHQTILAALREAGFYVGRQAPFVTRLEMVRVLERAEKAEAERDAIRARYTELLEAVEATCTLYWPIPALYNVINRHKETEAATPQWRIALRPDNPADDPLDVYNLLDDIAVKDVPMFRAEQMSPDHWWVCCYLSNEPGDTNRICWSVQARRHPTRIEWTAVEYPASGSVIYEHETKGTSG